MALKSQSVLSLPLKKSGISHPNIFQPCAKMFHSAISTLHILELSAMGLSNNIISMFT